ncbi:MAG TPA: hypothetical protein VIZ32_03230 [Vicinamibacterales bacterium]
MAEPQQDREINIIRSGTLNPQYHSPMRPEPTKERLDAKHTRVTVQNTSPNQNHIVIDRYNVGHELRPGERREMEMLDSEIANFQEYRRPGRFFPEIDPEHPEGRMKPPHPIVIEGVPNLADAPIEELDMRQRRKG